MIARILTTASALALTAGAASADFTMTILHINDFHDRFEPISGFDSTCSAEDNAAGECFGGIARVATAIEEARARAVNPLVVDAGDQFQGTLFYSFYKGDVSAEFMNRIGFDAMAIGNHEFNHGPETVRAFIEQVDFPVLMANADLSSEPLLSDVVQKSVTVEVGGETIGLIGLTPVNNDELSSPGPNIVFTDPAEAVQAEVDRLTSEGVNKIVVLSHSGHPVDLRLAEAVTGVDVIVGGHSNTLLGDMEGAEGPYPTVVNGVQIVTAYAYGKYLGEVVVTFDDDGTVIEAAGQPILLDASVAEDQSFVDRVAELAQPLEELRSTVVAESAASIEGDRSFCRAVECEMGNLVADAMLDRVADQGVQIAIANGGGLRASIDAGEVTMGEVLTVLPFQNTLSTFEVTGATLIEALENGVSEVADGGGRFPQVAGMSFTATLSNEVGSRISDVLVGGEPIDPEATYGVVSNNFVRNGGDGYAMFVDAANAYDFGPDLADVTAAYLAANSPYQPYTDGRITIVE
jgi:5'-nucleotidase